MALQKTQTFAPYGVSCFLVHLLKIYIRNKDLCLHLHFLQDFCSFESYSLNTVDDVKSPLKTKF